MADAAIEVTAADLEELELADDAQDTGTEIADADTQGDDEQPVNKWNARRSLSEMIDEEDEAKARPARSAAAKPDADDDEEDLDDDDDEEDEELEAKEPAAKAKPAGEADSTDTDTASGKPRYTVKDASGKSFAFKLEPGTVIQFQGDGSTREVKSLDELVQLAQKGVAFDRKTTEQGTTITKLQGRTQELEQNVKTVREVSEKVLLAALFDRNVRQQLRAELAPFRDPEYREGQAAKAKLAELENAESSSTEAKIEEQRTEFWQKVGNDIRAEIAGTNHLTDADVAEVANRFHAGYAKAQSTKFAELTAAGMSDEDATTAANKHAFAHFNEKNLRRVIRGLDAELADERKAIRLERKKAREGGDPKNEADAKNKVAAHNSRTNKQLELRRRTPRLQGGGAAPGGGSAAARSTGNGAQPRKSFASVVEGFGKTLRGGSDE